MPLLRVRASSELLVQLLTEGKSYRARCSVGLPPGCRLVWVRPVIDGKTETVSEVEAVFATIHEAQEDRVRLLGRAYVGHGVDDLTPRFERED